MKTETKIIKDRNTEREGASAPSRQATLWKKAIGYAYATSTIANQFGFKSGCYYIAKERSKGNGKIESVTLEAHKTIESAKISFGNIQLPISNFSL